MSIHPLILALDSQKQNVGVMLRYVAEDLKNKSSAAQTYDPIRDSYKNLTDWSLPVLCEAVCQKDVNKVCELLEVNPDKYIKEFDDNNR